MIHPSPHSSSLGIVGDPGLRQYLPLHQNVVENAKVRVTLHKRLLVEPRGDDSQKCGLCLLGSARHTKLGDPKGLSCQDVCLGDALLEVIDVSSRVIPVNGNKINVAAASASGEPGREPRETEAGAFGVGDGRGTEPSAASERVKVLLIQCGGLDGGQVGLFGDIGLVEAAGVRTP